MMCDSARRPSLASRLFHFSLCLIFLVSQWPVTTRAETEAETAAETERLLPGRATLGARGGEDVFIGTGDLLIPVWYKDGGLFFFNPRVALNDDSEEEVNLGLGYRYLLPDHHVILGGNVFYDSRWSRHNNQFDQYGFGVEILSKWIDARANWYRPERTKKVVDSWEESSVIGSRSSTSIGAPFPEDHAFKEKVTTTTSTTTRREMFEHFETTARGWDAEAGMWLPLQDILPIEVGLFAGYYSFDPYYGGDKIEGWKGRAEIRLLPALILDAEVYEDDQLNGTDYFIGGRVQVPFDLAALANGRNPFADTTEGYKPGRRAMLDRLTENVIRDPNIRMGEEVEKTGEETTTSTRTTTSKNTIMDDIQFVNDRNTSGIEDGTAERPFNTVQEGVDNVFGKRNVYVFAGKNSYNENVQINTPGVNLWGQGKAVVSPTTGKSFGGNKSPVIDGNVGGINSPSLRITANNVSVRGLDFTHSPGGVSPGILDAVFGAYFIDEAGILAENANNLHLLCNNLYDNSYGALILANGIENFQVILEKNDVWDNWNDGTRIHGAGASGSFNTLVDGNTFDGNGNNGLAILAQNYDDVALRLLNNSFSGNTLNGFFGSLFGDQQVLFDGRNNQANDNTASGFRMEAVSANGMVIGQLRNLSAHNNGNFGVLLDLIGDQGVFFGTLDPFLDLTGGATIYANGNLGAHGLSLQATSANGPVVSLIDEIIANNNVSHGVNLFLLADSTAIGAINNAQANDNGAFGLNVLLNSVNGSTIQTLSGLEASGNGGNGLLVNSVAPNGSVATLVGLPLALFNPDPVGTGMAVTDNNGAFGMQLLSTGNEVTTFIGNGHANSNAVFGIQHTANAQDNATVLMGFDLVPEGELLAGFLQANNNVAGSGIDVLASSANAETTVMFGNVEANNNAAHGINVLAAGDQEVLVGFGVLNFPGSPFDPLFGSATAHDNGIFGISFLVNSANSSASVVMNQVAANNNGVGGINGLVTADDSVFVLLGATIFGNPLAPWPDIQANGNQAASGISLLLNSASEDVTVIGGGIQANDNFVHGIELTAAADQDLTVILGLAEGSITNLVSRLVQANNNLNGDGLRLTGTATSGEIVFAVPEFQFDGNAVFGLNAALTANGTEDVTAMLGILQFPDAPFTLEGSGSASGNLGNSGIQLDLESAGGHVFANLFNVTADNNASRGFNILGDAPAGNIELLANQLQANNNALDGFRAVLNAGLSITGRLANVTANENGSRGVNIVATSTGGGIDLAAGAITVTSNGLDGFRVSLEADDDINLFVTNLIANGNSGRGLNLIATSNSGDVRIFGQNNVARNNGTDGLRVAANAAGTLELDFGGGPLGSLGQNSFTGNGSLGVRNAGSGTVFAQFNFWGNVPPTLGTDFNANVDASNHLLADPNP